MKAPGQFADIDLLNKMQAPQFGNEFDSESLQATPAKSRALRDLGWKLFNALFPRTLESFSRRFALEGWRATTGPFCCECLTEAQLSNF